MQRINYDAENESDVVQYFKTRQLQLASIGYTWDNVLYKNAYGYTAKILEEATGDTYDTFYVTVQNRSKGYSKHLVESLGKILTINDCGIISFLNKLGKEHKVVSGAFDTTEYRTIEKIYADGCAKRSKVFFMNHVDEGMIILNKLGKTPAAQAGFCLHPLTQLDVDLEKNFSDLVGNVDGYALMLSLEYRNIANQYLSRRSINNLSEINLSPLSEVNDMLVADKVQNYKDFLLYHKGTHPRSDILDNYFNNWLDKLDCREAFNWFVEYSKQFNRPVSIINV